MFLFLCSMQFFCIFKLFILLQLSCYNFFLSLLPPTPAYLLATVGPLSVVHKSFIPILWLILSPSFHHFPPHISPLIALSLFRVSMSLVLFLSLVYFIISSLDSSYTWGHMVFVFCRLAYFTKHSSLQFHPCCCKR